ncbi:T9SS type A sorting domain-containing protein [Lutibacter sp.]|uniref:T9SS type A sorting domain-containing protein n=1 Tax=Lutibacter sp. TaxID=1925666 RepID=UPI003563439C
MIKNFTLIYFFIITFCCISIKLNAQLVTLNANGPGNTYEEITNAFAPGRGVSAVEAPDDYHFDFGRHIAEVLDDDLGKYVFEFYSHLDFDNDPSTEKTDRQRIEIKTYASSPSHLKGTIGETIVYKWKFKIPVGFKPSSTFTHIHQIKPVDGNDGNPIFTLTPRKGTPNKMELTYVEDLTSVKKVVVELSLFEGIWVDVTETITVGSEGAYEIIINKESDGTEILSYSNSNILTIRPDNSFIRPKWGIYRSIVTPEDLRDEAVRFSDFSIEEITALGIDDVELPKITYFPNPVSSLLNINAIKPISSLKIINILGQTIITKNPNSLTTKIDFSSIPSAIYYIELIVDEKTQHFKIIKK